MGTRKLYILLEDFMPTHQIKMGRDHLADLLAAHGLLIKRRKRRVYTTFSSHWLRKYPNLIKGYTPSGSNQLWVSDITYWPIANQMVYVSLITDAYSRKIVGYQVAETLEAIHPLAALEMAINTATSPLTSLIHHSDRGVQYCSKAYVSLLKQHKVSISMSAPGAVLENSQAERINGILKEEYLSYYEVSSLKDAQRLAASMVQRYNEERPHSSISYLSPSSLHAHNQATERRWKAYYDRKDTCSKKEEKAL